MHPTSGTNKDNYKPTSYCPAKQAGSSLSGKRPHYTDTYFPAGWQWNKIFRNTSWGKSCTEVTVLPGKLKKLNADCPFAPGEGWEPEREILVPSSSWTFSMHSTTIFFTFDIKVDGSHAARKQLPTSSFSCYCSVKKWGLKEGIA